MNRQKKVLITLFVLLVLAIGYAYLMTPEQQRQAPQLEGERSEAVSATKEGSRQPNKSMLRIDLLEKESIRYQTPKRDIFNFASIRKKPVTKPKPKPPVVKPTVKPKPTPVVTPIVRQQLANFTLHGFLIKEEALTVFLSRGEDLFLVHEGDKFGDDNQFTALSITEDKMIINQARDSRNIEIILVEKEPLVPTMQQPDVSEVKYPAPAVRNKWPGKRAPNINR